ncbi:peptide chain release factor N(5)-glutamine methyltransferase [soil metagenome]
MSAAATATSTATVWTIKSLLAWTANYLKDKGIDTPRLEAELLLAHALVCKRIDLIVRYDEEPPETARTVFRELVKRRAEHWPTAYLIGLREFFLLQFEVSPAVLIPRPDTETLLMSVLDNVKGSPSILDLGTGSGILAVSLAHKLKTATVTAVDISPDALDIAKANAKRHGVQDRVTFLHGDLFAPLPDNVLFDCIVSNPPYVTSSEWATLDEEVREHEPKLALDGGPDGLAFYRRIANDAVKYLKPGGLLCVEIGNTQDESVRTLFDAADGLSVVKSVKDAAGRPRVVIARRDL